MGFFTAEKPVTLQPVHPPLGINLNMTHHPLVSLVLKEKAWSLSGVRCPALLADGLTLG